jgi:hypothetical protein
VFLLSRMSPSSEDAQEPAVCDVDPLDLVATIRNGLLGLDPDLTVRFADLSFGGTFTVTPRDSPEKEGSQ